MISNILECRICDLDQQFNVINNFRQNIYRISTQLIIFTTRHCSNLFFYKLRTIVILFLQNITSTVIVWASGVVRMDQLVHAVSDFPIKSPSDDVRTFDRISRFVRIVCAVNIHFLADTQMYIRDRPGNDDVRRLDTMWGGGSHKMHNRM